MEVSGASCFPGKVVFTCQKPCRHCGCRLPEMHHSPPSTAGIDADELFGVEAQGLRRRDVFCDQLGLSKLVMGEHVLLLPSLTVR